MIRPAHTTMDLTDDTLALLITVRTLPGRRDDVMTLWEDHLKERAADNPAQRVYFYCFNRTDEDVVHIFEVYDDLDAFEEAGESDGFQAYMEEVGPLLAGPVDVSMATPKWAKLP